MSREEEKQLLKEALKEWLDDKLSEFGWFSIKTLVIAAMGALVYFILLMNGWTRL